uniref:Uncharacterized protein n=1 Tax=Clostridium botulinum TaxID=1491 RepID=A0A0A0UTV2_CLOBO|nr:hypothetical protein [Clostridium botulinum]AIW54698.1 hypothetical protein [Clostridium botulinum]AIW54764.1 hypothetical protein [Clostridium botulinum]AIW54831.1 hypothetical protein [Clostridium botulinum]
MKISPYLRNFNLCVFLNHQPSIFPLCLSKPLQKTFMANVKLAIKVFWSFFMHHAYKEHKNFDKQLQ